MELYLAPLEGITGYVYRNAVHRVFGQGVDKYFTPFFAPHTKRTMNTREMRDVLNSDKDILLVPQILTNSSEDCLSFQRDMREFGFDEININMGCPSGTVVSKRRGAGMLDDPQKIDEFLYSIFEKKNGDISIKTRLGIESVEEFYDILEVYNKYELKELIIHPRLLKEYYKGSPHKDLFVEIIPLSKNKLCYNGDINTVDDYIKLTNDLKGFEDRVTAVMIGRGMIADPSLIRQIALMDRDKGRYNTNELKVFLSDLEENYKKEMSGETPVLFKLKEVWTYLRNQFPEDEKIIKKILKTKKLSEYDALMKTII